MWKNQREIKIERDLNFKALLYSKIVKIKKKKIFLIKNAHCSMMIADFIFTFFSLLP
jgi:hypothetical protein